MLQVAKTEANHRPPHDLELLAKLRRLRGNEQIVGECFVIWPPSHRTIGSATEQSCDAVPIDCLLARPSAADCA